jgi:hypothetical protein
MFLSVGIRCYKTGVCANPKQVKISACGVCGTVRTQQKIEMFEWAKISEGLTLSQRRVPREGK